MSQRLPALCRSAALGFVCFALAASDAAAYQVTPYGSGVNPPGSLVLLSGAAELGSPLVLGLQNSANPGAGLALALLSFATAPAPGFPSGVVLPGLGLAGPNTPGEVLLSTTPPNPFVTVGPTFWFGGASAPAQFPLVIPAIPSLLGVSLYAQGALVDIQQGNSIGLTNGLRLRIQSPGPDLTKVAPIPAGTFSMGSDAPDGAPYFGPIGPVHQVTISKPFWMGRHEVTQAEYQALIGTNPSVFVGPDRPVDHVTRFDAMAYCSALNAQQSALGKVPAGYEYRLPTEAEWEYACRAGTTTEFSFGPELFCNQASISYSYHSNSACSGSPAGTVPVGSYAPNAFGLFDMHGNVWEWCLDGFSAYTASAKTDPYVSGGAVGVFRGGTWKIDSHYSRSAYRYSWPRSATSDDVGFRVVLAPVLVPPQPEDPDPAKFALIPSGTFQMGSNAANVAPYFGQPNERPVHAVTISKPFWTGRYEVTQAEYEALMGTNPSVFVGPDRPVEGVNWFDAVAYCDALTAQQSALGQVPAGYQYRLPTEAEWEYACRAGTTTEFSFGPELFCNQANFSYSYHSNSACSGSPSGTVPVGSYTPNAFGLYDMHGNVWEWCLDSVAPYTATAKTDPYVTGGAERIGRGGCWADQSAACRSANRGVSSPFLGRNNDGIRVVLAPVLVP